MNPTDAYELRLERWLGDGDIRGRRIRSEKPASTVEPDEYEFSGQWDDDREEWGRILGALGHKEEQE